MFKVKKKQFLVLFDQLSAYVERGLSKSHLSPEQQNSLVRQLCTTIMAHTKDLRFSEREHVALLLVRQYPSLKGSFGPGHVSIIDSYLDH